MMEILPETTVSEMGQLAENVICLKIPTFFISSNVKKMSSNSKHYKKRT